MSMPALIPVERRKHIRLATALPALIIVHDTGMLCPCTVVDLSFGGGRLRLDQGVDVPDDFELLFTKIGDVRRTCRVAWRKDNFLGVEFSGRFDREH
jgi:hypothetical protein